jgi:hypothetical protein
VDTALKNGDFCLDSNGRPRLISGDRELLQRAMIRLNVPLGSFVYDAALGSQLRTLKMDDADFMEKAISMAREALRQLPELSVESARCSTEEPPTVAVQLSNSGKTTEIEVKL